MMLKQITAAVLNRLVFLTIVLFGISALTRTSGCGPGDNPASQIGRAISGLGQLSDLLQRH